MVRTIPIHAFRARHADGGFVLDVREPEEYAQGHVPGAVLAPVGQVMSAVATLPRQRPVHVICQSGTRSPSVTQILARLGIEAVSVEGGTAAWSTAGGPLVAGSRAR